jgi:hypothetical protein
MPNWCHNILTVSGNVEEVDKFISENQGRLDEGEFLLFSKAVPEPKYEGYEDGSNRQTEKGLPTWYDWRVDNWGTKWEPNIGQDAEIESLNGNGQQIKVATYKFDTAWGPAEAWFSKVIEQYKEVKFCLVYGEPGCDFGGSLIASSGEIISDSEGSAREYLESSMMWF